MSSRYDRAPAEIDRLKGEIRKREALLAELESAPTDRGGAAELAAADPDKFNRLFEAGVLDVALNGKEQE